MFRRVASTAFILLTVLASGLSASAAEVQTGKIGTEQAKAPTVTTSVFEPIITRSMTPALGRGTLGVLPDAHIPEGPLAGALTPPTYPDFAASAKVGVMGGEFGVFSGYNSRANLFESAPTTGWNFGASVGYAGFYLRAGVSSDAAEAAARIVNDSNRGWLAGLGYEFGAFDLRLTYMASTPIGITDRDVVSRLWMIGGIYQLSPRIRLNADAFTGNRDFRNGATVLTMPVNSAAPQGTGARVGVQLKF
jgi:hypothetical protein